MSVLTRKNPNLIASLGLVFLAVASVASYVIQRKTALPESVSDPVIGFLYGVAIATTLLGVYRQSRAWKGDRSK